MSKKIALLAFFIAFSFLHANAQTKEIKGIVTSKENGELLDLVVVWLKGTNQGLITGQDGVFELQVNKGDTIEFSSSHHKTVEMLVSSSYLYKAELELNKTESMKAKFPVTALSSRNKSEEKK